MPLPLDGMRAKHIIIALAGGFTVYLALALVFGPSGLIRYSARIGYYNEILENVEDLRRREDRLLSELESLRTSSGRLRLHARTLGYYRPGERRIVIADNPGIEEPPSPGRVVSRSFEYDDPRPALRLAALVIVGGLLALQLAFEGRDTCAGAATGRNRAQAAHSAPKNSAGEHSSGHFASASGFFRESGESATHTGSTQERPVYSDRVQTASRE